MINPVSLSLSQPHFVSKTAPRAPPRALLDQMDRPSNHMRQLRLGALSHGEVPKIGTSLDVQPGQWVPVPVDPFLHTEIKFLTSAVYSWHSLNGICFWRLRRNEVRRNLLCNTSRKTHYTKNGFRQRALKHQDVAKPAHRTKKGLQVLQVPSRDSVDEIPIDRNNSSTQPLSATIFRPFLFS